MGNNLRKTAGMSVCRESARGHAGGCRHGREDREAGLAFCISVSQEETDVFSQNNPESLYCMLASGHGHCCPLQML